MSFLQVIRNGRSLLPFPPENSPFITNTGCCLVAPFSFATNVSVPARLKLVLFPLIVRLPVLPNHSTLFSFTTSNSVPIFI